jgi:prepilin-type processing-associated H-X9-DG protein
MNLFLTPNVQLTRRPLKDERSGVSEPRCLGGDQGVRAFTLVELLVRAANNPQAGQPEAESDVELIVDVYFPGTLASVAPALSGQAAHSRGRNRLMLDGHVEFARDPRLR